MIRLRKHLVRCLLKISLPVVATLPWAPPASAQCLEVTEVTQFAGTPWDNFGRVLAISGDTVVVYPNADDPDWRPDPTAATSTLEPESASFADAG